MQKFVELLKLSNDWCSMEKIQDSKQLTGLKPGKILENLKRTVKYDIGEKKPKTFAFGFKPAYILVGQLLPHCSKMKA